MRQVEIECHFDNQVEEIKCRRKIMPLYYQDGSPFPLKKYFSFNNFRILINDLCYEPFFADFGPLDLGKVHLFCK